jgi:dienelactone hydrolase
MPEIVVFHHAQGLTDDVIALASTLRDAGHTVHTPDLFTGRAFPTIEDGVAHAESIGFSTLLERGRRATDALAADLVYVGLSLGVLPAQLLARPARERAARCSPTRASRRRSSAAAGRRVCRCRST